MRMLIEIRGCPLGVGIRIAIDPKTVEALLAFVAKLAGYHSDEQSASSDTRALE